MPRKTSKRIDPFWSEFAKELAKRTEKLPEGEGWMTFAEMMEVFDVGESQLREKLKFLERFRGNRLLDGKLRCMVWYRPRQKK